MSEEVSDRVRRLLVLVPYVAEREEGVALEELIEVAGYPSEQALYSDLQLLQLIGVPPGAPDDLIDVYVDGGRVFVSLPQGFRRPPRLSVVEAAALLASAEPLREAAGSTLASAIEKLKRALPPGSEKALASLERASAIDASAPPPWHQVLVDAIESRTEVTLDYWAASTGEKHARQVEPMALFVHHGRWYLAAFNAEKQEEHLYRLDRVAGVRVGSRHFPVHANDPSKYDQARLWFGKIEHEVEAIFGPEDAPFVCERWSESTRMQPDGSACVTTRLSGDAFVVSWILGRGGAATLKRPEALRAEVARTAAQLLELYR
jgi:predicted DNA-binding transcriptional regulator YafY